MQAVLYPGSFDPVTNGHLDIIVRASRIFSEVVIGVAINPEKQGLFSVEERIELLTEVCSSLPNIRVVSFSGLLVDAVRKFKVCAVIRGLRAVSDFEYEFQMALMNKELSAQCETLFMMPKPEYTFVSSRLIKEIFKFNGDITPFVPRPVINALDRKKRML